MSAEDENSLLSQLPPPTPCPNQDSSLKEKAEISSHYFHKGLQTQIRYMFKKQICPGPLQTSINHWGQAPGIFFFFFFWGHTTRLVGSKVPPPGIKPRPPTVKMWSADTGLPGNSKEHAFLTFKFLTHQQRLLSNYHRTQRLLQWILCSILCFTNQSILPQRTTVKAQR